MEKLKQEKLIKIEKLKQEHEKKQRMIEEQQDKITQEISIKKLNLSGDFRKNSIENAALMSTKLSPILENVDTTQEKWIIKEKVLKIKNVDWFTTHIRKSIENNSFDINWINLFSFEEIHDNYKSQSQSNNQLMTSAEVNSGRSENKWDHIKEFIDQILISKKDWLIRYNEIDGLINFVQSRFEDVRK